MAFRQLQDGGCTEPYGQCGGQTCSNGAQSCTDSAYTCCPSNYSCQRQSQWYWQCQPAAATYASGMPASFTDCIGAPQCFPCSCKGMLVSIFITRQLVHYVGQPALCKSPCTAFVSCHFELNIKAVLRRTALNRYHRLYHHCQTQKLMGCQLLQLPADQSESIARCLDPHATWHSARELQSIVTP